MSATHLRIAIIDMYDDTSNLGMTCIVAIINAWSKKKDIEIICGIIMATKIPQRPKNYLEEIICDADLNYLG